MSKSYEVLETDDSTIRYAKTVLAAETPPDNADEIRGLIDAIYAKQDEATQIDKERRAAKEKHRAAAFENSEAEAELNKRLQSILPRNPIPPKAVAI